MNVVDFGAAQKAGEAIEQDAVKNVVTSLLPAAESAVNEILKATTVNSQAVVDEALEKLNNVLEVQRLALFANLAKFRDETIVAFNKVSITIGAK